MKLSERKIKKLIEIYNNYCREAYNITDISRWCKKVGISKKTLEPSRTNEQKILDAVQHLNPREGDKYFLYTAVDGEKQAVTKGEPVFLKSGQPKMVKNSILKVVDQWSADEDKEHYIKRVYMTLSILENVIDMDKFIKYQLKKNYPLLEDL